MLIRPARADDLPAISAIQRASPEASQWAPAGFGVTVAEVNGSVVGFLVTQSVAQDQVEVLNVAVAPEFRRRGVAHALLEPLLKGVQAVFLEVRESNAAARNLYKSIGFEEIGRRAGYYQSPCESSIVMKFHSC